MQRLEKILGQKSGSKSSLTIKLLQFSQRHPKPAFSETVQRRGQGKFSKNRPKSSPSLKDIKALAQMPLSCNLNALKVQRLEKILGQKSGSKSSLTIKLLQFSQGHPNPHFLKKCKGGTRENFSKIAQKVALV